MVGISFIEIKLYLTNTIYLKKEVRLEVIFWMKIGLILYFKIAFRCFRHFNKLMKYKMKTYTYNVLEV